VDSPSAVPTELRALLVESNRQVLQSINSLKDDIGELRSTFSSLERRIGGIEAALASFRESQAKCEIEVSSIRKEVELLKSSEKKFSFEILQEVERRERRRDKIMIYGLQEKLEGSLDQRSDHDKALVEEICSIIDAEDVSIEATFRLGKTSDSKCRPLKVQLSDSSSKGEVLRKAKNLRSSNYKDVFIKSDMTKLQRQEELDLRKELKRRKENGEDVIIRGGEVQLRNQMKNFRN